MSGLEGDQLLDWRAAVDDLRATLVAEQERRDERRGMVNGQPEWIAAERKAMVHRVNLLRSRRGLGPVATDAVERKENRACGHVDYTAKFALGCADLVYGGGSDA